jgi:hypothetical protein
MKNGELTVTKQGSGNIKLRMPDGEEKTLKKSLSYTM